MQWLVDAKRGADRVRPNEWTLYHAAYSGHLELVQWLVNAERGADRLRPDQETIGYAARSGNQELVQWLEEYMAEEAQQSPAVNALQL